MEIIWLSALTAAFVLLVAIYAIDKYWHKGLPKKKLGQSQTYEVVKSFINSVAKTIVDKPKTQSEVYEDRMHVKVVLTDSQAFWIVNNTLFVAEQVDGIIEKDTTRPVDTMGMDKVELDKTAIIVDALTEEGGEDDYRSTRN